MACDPNYIITDITFSESRDDLRIQFVVSKTAIDNTVLLLLEDRFDAPVGVNDLASLSRAFAKRFGAVKSISNN